MIVVDDGSEPPIDIGSSEGSDVRLIRRWASASSSCLSICCLRSVIRPRVGEALVAVGNDADVEVADRSGDPKRVYTAGWGRWMKFEWDETKNQANIRKHGLSFGDAHEVFAAPMLVEEDEREDYGEQRWVGVGFLVGRIVVLVWSEPDEETIRVISIRKALSHERRRYERAIRNRLG